MKTKIACVASKSPVAQEGLSILLERYDFTSPEDADVLVALGGDGFMLDTLHKYYGKQLKIYGMNRGTVGFLMNEFKPHDLIERIDLAMEHHLYPLHMSVTGTDGVVHTARAFNEVALVRYSQQASNLQIVIDGKVRMEKLISDGVLVCTPAGSTAYNMSVRGPVIPIDADLLGLTPISPFRPRGWRGALLPYTAVIEVKNLDPVKRPLGASADSTEIKNVASVVVEAVEAEAATVLFDRGHTLEDRIINEQFAV
jgi:NAD+ kinase